MYYYGARYLDPKYSRWLSGDLALAEYMSSSSAGAGGIYNTVNLNGYHYGGNNPIKYTDPTGRNIEEGASVSRQLEYLHSYTDKKYETAKDKANAAKALRTEMRGSGKGNFDLDELFLGKDGDEKFMNETLRDFLNTSDTGKDYTIDDMKIENGWEKARAATEHQETAVDGFLNLKYVNKDGREAVFTRDGENMFYLKINGTKAHITMPQMYLV